MRLSDWKGKSGVYFITTNVNDDGKPMWIKIGMAKNRLDNRIDSYLLCYPVGFYVLAVLHTSSKNAAVLENMIHGALRTKMRQMKTLHSHSGEWFELTLQDVKTLYQSLLTVTPNYMYKTTSVEMVDNPWFIRSNYRPLKQKDRGEMNMNQQRLYTAIHGIETVKKPKKLRRHSYNPKTDKHLDFEPFMEKEREEFSQEEGEIWEEKKVKTKRRSLPGSKYPKISSPQS